MRRNWRNTPVEVRTWPLCTSVCSGYANTPTSILMIRRPQVAATRSTFFSGLVVADEPRLVIVGRTGSPGRNAQVFHSNFRNRLKFRVCAETCRSGSANHHTLALTCTGKTGQNKTFPAFLGRSQMPQLRSFVTFELSCAATAIIAQRHYSFRRQLQRYMLD